MKKVILALLIIAAVSCKEQKKQDNSSDIKMTDKGTVFTKVHGIGVPDGLYLDTLLQEYKRNGKTFEFNVFYNRQLIMSANGGLDRQDNYGVYVDTALLKELITPDTVFIHDTIYTSKNYGNVGTVHIGPQ